MKHVYEGAAIFRNFFLFFGEQNVETDEKRTTTKTGYQISTKQGSEAALTLATLHNAGPGPSWYKVSSANSRSRVALGENAEPLAEGPSHFLNPLSAGNEEQGINESCKYRSLKKKERISKYFISSWKTFF